MIKSISERIEIPKKRYLHKSNVDLRGRIMRKFIKILKNENGQALVLVALLMTVFMGFAALSINLGTAYVAKANLQKAADAAALAGASVIGTDSNPVSTATTYATANGVPQTGVSVNPTNTDPTKIEVVCTETVPFTFAKVLGITQGNVSARAVAQQTTGTNQSAFGYALFSNSNLSLSGNNLTINGNAHTNSTFTMSGNNNTITGQAEAASTFTTSGNGNAIGTAEGSTISTSGNNNTIGSKIQQAAANITMPDFSNLILTQAKAANQYYTTDQTFSGNNTNVNGSIYVNGNVTISGNNFTGNGFVFATGNISISGNSGSANTSQNSVCFYTKTGTITISGNNPTIYGLLYAPNGAISISGNNPIIYGSVVGNSITISGNNPVITSTPGELKSLPSIPGSVKLVQ